MSQDDREVDMMTSGIKSQEAAIETADVGAESESKAESMPSLPLLQLIQQLLR